MARPLYVYDNWSTYDELSDNVPLTEELALFQLAQVERLMRAGVTFDSYLMDAFWYARDGGYLSWNKERWPNGPDQWLERCQAAGLKPGLWFPANTCFHLECPESWRNSLAENDYGFCCFEGGFLSGFMEVLHHWYQRGVRIFKFDFAEFGAVPKGREALASGARDRNITAYRAALTHFRASHPETVLLAYNGFEFSEFMPTTDQPVRPVFDRAWLEVFETVYCGDPRPADVPLPNFWRTCDVYADAMIHLLHRGSGLALTEIDNCAFMIGNTGTCYRRGSASWRTTALLSYARGCQVHVAMGNLEALSDEDAVWLAQVQAYFEGLPEPRWVGGNPALAELYAYARGNSVTVVNPSLEMRSLVVGDGYRMLYGDGFARLSDGAITLGPGAVAVAASDGPDLGQGEDPEILLETAECEWVIDSSNAYSGLMPEPGGSLHVLFRQVDRNQKALRFTLGPPPVGPPSSDLLTIQVTQDGRELPVQRPDARAIWSGMSWAYGVVGAEEIGSGPLHVRVSGAGEGVDDLWPALYWAKER